MWPSPFPIPLLSHDVELRLKKGNEEYAKNKKGMGEVPRDMSSDILNKISQVSFSIKAYPEPHEVESIAVALILKYPCLKEDIMEMVTADGLSPSGTSSTITDQSCGILVALRFF